MNINWDSCIELSVCEKAYKKWNAISTSDQSRRFLEHPDDDLEGFEECNERDSQVEGEGSPDVAQEVSPGDLGGLGNQLHGLCLEEDVDLK